MYAVDGMWLIHLYKKNFKNGAFTNSEDPDETPQNATSHQGLHCLPC